MRGRGTIVGWAVAGALGCLLMLPAGAAAQLPPLLPTPPSPSPPPASPAPTPAPAPPVAGGPEVGSSTEVVNPARTGYAEDPNLVAPLVTRWSRSLGSETRRVIYGDGRLYASAGNALVALDAATGKTIWRATQISTQASYGGGLVVSKNVDGATVALSARTGTVQWSAPNTAGTGPAPLIDGGRVYVEDSARVTALSLRTGAVLWRAPSGASQELLSTDGERVFAATVGMRTMALDADTGRQLWSRFANSGGGGGSAVHRGRVYSAASSSVFDAASGNRLGNLGSQESVFAGDLWLQRSSNTLRAVHLPTGRVRWRVRGLAATDGSELEGRSIAIGRSVFAFGTNQRLFVNSLDDGSRQQVIRLRAGPSDSDESTMASAPGILVVPTGSRITAYQSSFRPPAAGVAAGATVADVEFGRRSAFAGVVGTSLRANRQVSVEIAGHRARRYRRLPGVRVQPDGYFSASLKLSRNARIRVKVGAARSAVVRLYVYPRFRPKLSRDRSNPNRIRASVRVTGPRSVRLARRRIVLYLAQPGRKRYVRLGAARLQRAGRGRARAAVRFNAIRRVRRGDFLIYCVPRSSRLGLGRPDALDRRCGARRIPLR